MPDITMCQDHDCPMRETCWRYTAPVSPHRQSYFGERVREADGSCRYYWRVKRDAPEA